MSPEFIYLYIYIFIYIYTHTHTYIHTHTHIYIYIYFTRDGIDNTNKSHWWSDTNPNAIVERKSVDWDSCFTDSSDRVCYVDFLKMSFWYLCRGSSGYKDAHGLPA